MAASIIQHVISEFQAAEATTHVDKDIDLQIDLGNLLGTDINSLDILQIRNDKETYLRNIARDNTQLLINSIFKLPQNKLDDVSIVTLPTPVYKIPREKPLPKVRATTRWDEFAKTKGISKRKKAGRVWDDNLQKWVASWGFDKKKATRETDWAIEVPHNADPYEDPFEKREIAKIERVAKNELQRLRNIARSTKKMPNVGVLTADKLTRSQAGRALSNATKSTASLGEYTKKLKAEPTTRTAKKQKFKDNHCSFADEKTQHLALFDSIMSKKPKLNVKQYWEGIHWRNKACK